MPLAESLEDLHRELVTLVGKVEPMVSQAVASLSKPEPDLPGRMREADSRIDEREVEIEEACLKLLALHQPVSQDLRRVFTCLKITGELERIADLAVNLTERSQAMYGKPSIKIPADVSRMATMGQEMLRAAMKSYLHRDVETALAVIRRDDEVDTLNHAVIQHLTGEMFRDATRAESILQLIWATLHLERIADHTTNIAEDVVFLVTGRIVRHNPPAAADPVVQDAATDDVA